MMIQVDSPKRASAATALPCMIKGCGRDRVARNTCRKHYQSISKMGVRNRLPRNERQVISPAAGSTTMVSKDSSERHLKSLLDMGYSYHSISQASGVPFNQLCALIYGRSGGRQTKTLRSDYEARILAVEPSQMLKPVMPAVGATRRLRAMMCLGYSAMHLSRLSGLSYGTVNRILHDSQTPIKSSTYKLVCDLYEELSMKPLDGVGRSSRARGDASRRGWHPPLAWDDIDLDREPHRG